MKELKIIQRELEKIKNNKPSFLGMDGGNINSNIWVCGVEFGSDLDEMEHYYQNHIKTHQIDGLRIPYRDNCPDYFINSDYDRRLALMCLGFSDDNLDTRLNKSSLKEDIDSFLKSDLYNKTSRIFKLNLYPLGKKDMSWSAEIENKLGITKDKYYGTYFENRVKFIKKLTNKYTPKVIICTSPKGHENTFVETFFKKNQPITFSYNFLNIEGKDFKISVYDDGIKKVVIIPFLGWGNLNSYLEVVRMSNYLAKEFIDDLPF